MHTHPSVAKRRGIPGGMPSLLGIGVAVQYLCVPETDHLLTIGLIAIGLATAELATARTFATSEIALAIIVVWAGWYGATGRQSALIGAAAAFWPAAVVASVQRMTRLATIDLVILAGVCTVASTVVARTGALEPTASPAIWSVAIYLPASLLVAGAVLARQRQQLAAKGPT